MPHDRISHKTVTFSNPFRIKRFDDLFPPGSYVVETTEELVEGVSFTAYRRVATALHIKGKLNGMIVDRILDINPVDLDLALAQDCELPPDPNIQ